MDTQVSERIRKFRLAARLSKNRFAKELGVSRSHISRIENGVGNVSTLLLTDSYRLSVWVQPGVAPHRQPAHAARTRGACDGGGTCD